jgi:hypothetical protein
MVVENRLGSAQAVSNHLQTLKLYKFDEMQSNRNSSSLQLEDK